MDEILVENIIHLSENKCVRNFLILFSALGLSYFINEIRIPVQFHNIIYLMFL